MKNNREICSNTSEIFEIGIWDINLTEKSIFWDKKTKSLFEVQDYFKPNYKNSLTFINRKNLIIFKTLIKKAAENKIPIFGKLQIITANKTIKHIECICQVESTDCEITRIYGTFKDATEEEERIIDATQGRRTRSIIIMETNQIVLSALMPETLTNRVNEEIIEQEGTGKE